MINHIKSDTGEENYDFVENGWLLVDRDVIVEDLQVIYYNI